MADRERSRRAKTASLVLAKTEHLNMLQPSVNLTAVSRLLLSMAKNLHCPRTTVTLALAADVISDTNSSAVAMASEDKTTWALDATTVSMTSLAMKELSFLALAVKECYSSSSVVRSAPFLALAAKEC